MNKDDNNQGTPIPPYDRSHDLVGQVKGRAITSGSKNYIGPRSNQRFPQETHVDLERIVRKAVRELRSVRQELITTSKLRSLVNNVRQVCVSVRVFVYLLTFEFLCLYLGPYKCFYGK